LARERCGLNIPLNIRMTFADAPGCSSDEPRLPRETRTAFIRRVLLGETEPVEAPEG
jgi:hypothetical protein